MTASTRAPGYDLFKTIVAIILLLIFLLLWFGIEPVRAPQAQEAFIPTFTLLPPTETPLPTQTAVPASSTPQPPTATATTSDTPTPLAVTETPALTEEPLPTPIVEIPSEPEICAAISRSQLQVGMKAIIQRRLNFRSSPGIFNNLILTNVPGTKVEVVGGPACTRYENGGAYLWWEIKLPNGLTGWSAEASAFGSFYFMESAP